MEMDGEDSEQLGWDGMGFRERNDCVDTWSIEVEAVHRRR